MFTKSIRSVLIAFAFSASAANADSDLFIPALFDVSGVDSNDTLNIRSSPVTSSDIIGEFAHSDINIEVVALSSDGKWGLVNIEEQSGWTFMRYLKPTNTEPFNFPLYGISCHGTEPFWSLSFGGDNRAFGDWRPFDPVFDEASAYKYVWTAPPLARPGSTLGFWMKNNKSVVSGALEAELCSDGMSDRSYGWSVNVLLQSTGDPVLISGCCSVGGY